MSGVEDCPVPVPLLATALGTDARSVMLAYGNHLQPVMERVVSGELQQHGVDFVQWVSFFLLSHTICVRIYIFIYLFFVFY